LKPGVVGLTVSEGKFPSSNEITKYLVARPGLIIAAIHNFTVLDAGSNEPIQNVIINLFQPINGRVIKTVTTDIEGKGSILMNRGEIIHEGNRLIFRFMYLTKLYLALGTNIEKIKSGLPSLTYNHNIKISSIIIPE